MEGNNIMKGKSISLWLILSISSCPLSLKCPRCSLSKNCIFHTISIYHSFKSDTSNGVFFRVQWEKGRCAKRISRLVLSFRCGYSETRFPEIPGAVYYSGEAAGAKQLGQDPLHYMTIAALAYDSIFSTLLSSF